MPTRVQSGEVASRVRRAALELGQFTADHVVKLTGLKPKSVNTAINRLMKVGLVESRPTSSSEGPGRPACVYHLTEDPDRRLELSRQVHGPVHRPVSGQPVGQVYRRLAQTLDETEQVRDAGAQRALLNTAQGLLDVALASEGGDYAPPPVRPYIEYQRARLLLARRRFDDAVSAAQVAAESLKNVGEYAAVRDAAELGAVALMQGMILRLPELGRGAGAGWSDAFAQLLDTARGLRLPIVNLLEDVFRLGMDSQRRDLNTISVQSASQQYDESCVADGFRQRSWAIRQGVVPTPAAEVGASFKFDLAATVEWDYHRSLQVTGR